jgi:copper(I)-binding protein
MVVVVVASMTAGCRADVGGAPVGDGDIIVLDAWSRPSPATTTDAAFYLTIDNRTDQADHYAGASSDRCGAIVPHLTTFDDDGVTSMTALDDALDVPAGEQVSMEPNGLHLMCVGLDAPLAEGDAVDVEIDFDEHPPVRFTVSVERR